MNIKVMFDEKSVIRTLARLSHEIIEKNDHENEICIIGIRSRGVSIAKILAENVRSFSDIKVNLGELTSEEIKINIGAAIRDLDVKPDPFIVRGPNIMTAHPVEIAVTSEEVAHCLDKSLAKIETSILQVLEQTPPELYQDIVEKGIFLTGGGALLRGLDKRLYEKINIPFHVAEDPLRAVARGTSLALKGSAHYSFLMR